MKGNNRYMAILLGGLLLVLSGCAASTETSGKPSSETSPSPAPSANDNLSGSNEEKGDETIKQEEVEIKLRVDSPSYKDFFEWSEPGPVIPGLNQDLIPQGIAYEHSNDWMIVSYYRKDKRPSMLTVIQLTDGKLVKSVELYKDENTPYNGHAGGLTVSDSHVWLSSEKSVYQIKIEDLEKVEDGGKLIISDIVRIETNGSYVYYSDGILWVGEFSRANYKTDETHHMNNRDDRKYAAWITGYKLNADDSIDPAKIPEDSKPAVPDYILSVPEEIQGMETMAGSVILSQSYGRNNESSLLAYRWTLEEDPHVYTDKFAEPVPIWFLDSKNAEGALTLPPMSEGIVKRDGRLYVLFESGAAEYRNGLYPLDRIYSLEVSQWLDSQP
ncbi:hypothetical protein [Paenibacillus sp. J2TS4]|uniref:hypothetical protein n=1 Tax=Paenibacillus sp. J2TS4 TaxID=2807194 RepID=UPI001B0EBC84|nr:hypothetical protein [Paenibacillus sp. J2TS4]GIP33230.1 hypothetical protein J2TS4_24400 [Paenibacillus sp. J2TS4]